MSARSSVSIEFFADLSCPWCYVGWVALKQAASQTCERAKLALVWRSFFLTDAPIEGAPREALSPENKALLTEAARALDLSLDLRRAKTVPNTMRAHRLVHLASNYDLGEAMIDALFEAYFGRGEDIGDAGTLIGLAEREGLDPEEVANIFAKANFSDLRAMHDAAVKAGIGGAPVAIFNRKAVLMGAESVKAYANAITSVA